MALDAFQPRDPAQQKRVDALELFFRVAVPAAPDALSPPPRAQSPAAALPAALCAAAAELEALRGLGHDAEMVAQRLDAALERLSAVAEEKQRVSSKTSSLTKTCEALLAEQTALEDKVQFMLRPLGHFRDVDRLADVFGVDREAPPRIAAGTPAFSETLQTIDAALLFFDAHMRYKDAAAYRSRMARVQLAALTLAHDAVKDQCAAALRTAVYQSGGANGAQRSSESAAEHQLEAWTPFAKFRGLAPRLRLLTRDLELRAYPDGAAAAGAATPPALCPRAGELLEKTQLEYLGVRKRLVAAGVRKELARLALLGRDPSLGGRGAGGAALLSLVRLGASYLGRFLTLEAQLFVEAYGDAVARLSALPPERALVKLSAEALEDLQLPAPVLEEDGEAEAVAGPLWQALEEVLGALYGLARPLLVHCNDIDALCALVETVREELDRRRHYARTHALSEAARLLAGEAGPLAWILRRCAADAQERLSLVGRQHLLSEVAAYLPKEEDLDYPGILERYVATAAARGADPGSESLDVFDTWYPPVGALLRLLAQLYRAVETNVFEDLANAAVTACTKSLISTRASLRARGKSPGDAEMFLVRHLLVLREQLSPFNIRLLHVERSLDFSSTAQALQAFMQSGGLLSRRVFRIDAANPLVHLLVEGRPRVKEDATDGKAALEMHLKEGCNTWIELALSDILGPIKEWLTKVSALAMEADDTGAAPRVSAAGVERLRALPLASPERIRGLVSEALTGARQALPLRLRQLHLYILNASTQSVLFRPVQRRVTQALQDVTAVVQQLEALDEAGDAAWAPVRAALKELNTLVVTADTTHIPELPTPPAQPAMVATPPVAEALEAGAVRADGMPGEAPLDASDSGGQDATRASHGEAAPALAPAEAASPVEAASPAASPTLLREVLSEDEV